MAHMRHSATRSAETPSLNSKDHYEAVKMPQNGSCVDDMNNAI